MTMLAIKVPENISSVLQSISIDSEIVRSDPSDHITSFYFEDEMNVEEAVKIIPIIFSITQKTKPFIINFDSFSSFPEGKYGYPLVCQLKSSELLKLREEIKKSFDKNDIKFSNKFPKFIPHITIGYYKNKIKDSKFDKLSFQVNKISLYVNSDNKEKETLYVEFPFGKLVKYSNDCLEDFSGQFQKLAYENTITKITNKIYIKI